MLTARALGCLSARREAVIHRMYELIRANSIEALLEEEMAAQARLQRHSKYDQQQTDSVLAGLLTEQPADAEEAKVEQDQFIIIEDPGENTAACAGAGSANGIGRWQCGNPSLAF